SQQRVEFLAQALISLADLGQKLFSVCRCDLDRLQKQSFNLIPSLRFHSTSIHRVGRRVTLPSSASLDLVGGFPESKLPSSIEDGMLGRRPSGGGEAAANGCAFGSSPASNHPDSTSALLSAPPCPRRAAPFSSLEELARRRWVALLRFL